MVKSRKDKESFLGRNLLYLRKQKGRTMEEMANFLELSSKSSYKAYEEERALPDIHKVMQLASFFDVAVADLVYQDLANPIGQKNTQLQRTFEVAIVPVAAAAGYARGFGDNDYVMNLETIKIPFEPYGITRAFEIDGDSMEPEIQNGSTVIGVRVTNATIRDNKSYIVITHDGLQCKHVRIDEEGDFIYLISRNVKYPPKHIKKDEVKEMWEVWKTL